MRRRMRLLMPCLQIEADRTGSIRVGRDRDRFPIRTGGHAHHVRPSLDVDASGRWSRCCVATRRHECGNKREDDGRAQGSGYKRTSHERLRQKVGRHHVMCVGGRPRPPKAVTGRSRPSSEGRWRPVMRGVRLLSSSVTCYRCEIIHLQVHKYGHVISATNLWAAHDTRRCVRLVLGLEAFGPMRQLPAIARATDWLIHWEESLNASTEAEALSNHGPSSEIGLITFLASRLDRAEQLWRPSEEELEPLHSTLAVIPTQLAFVPMDTSHGVWLGLAALAEFRGAGPLARFVVDCLERHTVELRSADVDAADELCGIFWTRRGRIARLAGALDDAVESYHEALRLTRRLAWRDAWPNAQLGLANVEIARGNYPAAQRRMVGLLRRRDAVHPMYRVSGYQTLANTRRKRGDLLGALLDGWTAFDLLTPDDARRNEVLISMAETALDIGDADAALQAFTQVLEHPLPLRVEVAAASGVVRARLLQSIRTQGSLSTPNAASPAATMRAPMPSATFPHHTDALMHSMERVEALLTRDAAPRERAYMLLTLADGARHFGDGARARTFAHSATELATNYGFHDYVFRADQLLAQLAVASAEVSAAELTEPVRGRVLAHSALVRLRALTTR